MAINYFVYSMLIIAFFSVIATVSKREDNFVKKEKAQIVFDNSTLYTINTQDIERVVNSSSAMRFKNRDVMYDGKIILRAKDNSTDYIESDVIVKRKDNYKFLNNVKYNKENSIVLNTQELFYNMNTKIAKNSKPFDGYYYEHKLKGTNLYLDSKKSVFKSERSHFEIELDNKGK